MVEFRSHLSRGGIESMHSSRIQMKTAFALAAAVVTTVFTAPVAAQTVDESITGGYSWRQVGPANMSGRVSDVAVPVGGEDSVIYVAASAGGLWKTINNGTTWEQVFEGGKTAAVGDIAIAPSDPDVIYLGMGEPHSRNSISWGDGVWRSRDGGESWDHMGLEDTYHIGRIVVDPRDPDVVYVAALGNLWDRNMGERGLFKSTNGGRRWSKVKGFDDGTGFYDVILDPTNPDIVWATSWERERKPWILLSGGGPNNGLWNSTDGGSNWTRIEGGGLPPSDRNGKMSVDIFPDDPSIMFVRIENFADDPEAPEPEEGGSRQFMRRRTPPSLSGTYRSTDGGRIWERFDRRNGRAFYYNQLRVDPHDANRVYLIEGSLYRADVREAFKWVNNYEQGEGDDDRGVTDITNGHHVDFHAMWIDPDNTDHLIVGSDGGISISWDQGENWNFCENLCLAQFYAVGYDMAEPYNVYGGLQDNGTWGGPHMAPRTSGIRNEGWHNYHSGDGFHAQVDPFDPDLILYAESQGGNLSRVNIATGERAGISPRAPRPEGEEMSARERMMAMMGMGGSGPNVVSEVEPGTRFRFNWSAPIILSPHNPHTIYYGGQFLFRSVDRGDSWTIISPDLTTADEEKYTAVSRGDFATGAENYCNIITIGESPLVPGLLWVGTDDGRVHLTRDGGGNWTEVTDRFPGVPPTTWVSRVRPSGFEEGRAWVTFDGHRYGDNTTYVYRTDDFGETFVRLSAGLPEDDPAYVITEDPYNPNLVFLGTEHGVYVSLDMGASWTSFSNNLPVTPVHDLTIHPRDRDVIIGTHGLGAWVMDDITGLESLTQEVMEKDFGLLDVAPLTLWNLNTPQEFPGDQVWEGENPALSIRVNYWIGEEVDNVKITLQSISGETVREIEGPGERGLNLVEITTRPTFGMFGGMDPEAEREVPLVAGTYLLTVEYGDTSETAMVELRPDPRR